MTKTDTVCRLRGGRSPHSAAASPGEAGQVTHCLWLRATFSGCSEYGNNCLAEFCGDQMG